jgi:hypothetical protein
MSSRFLTNGCRSGRVARRTWCGAVPLGRFQLSEALQLLGAVLILVPFAWTQLGSMRPDSVAYLFLNLIGSSLLAAVALQGSQWGFLLLEGIWALFSARGLITRHQPRA